jgi:ElaB/YqjD/DUF883 family membrane-anchored ribosome-binding protein
MASRSYSSKKPEYGIIILGNSGSGKSFLCNIIIGSTKFQAGFQPDAVTTATEHHRIETSKCDYLVYNIPGLIEADQERIDLNKKEIQKAFNECPTSVVLFVWRQTGGRVQNDDVIAFNALNEAYKFPRDGLLFVINNVPVQRPMGYEGKFIATLNNLLKPMSVSDIDAIFIDTLDMGDQTNKNSARTKLMKHIMIHPAMEQKQQKEIRVESKALKELREQLKKQQEDAEKDRDKLKKEVEEMTKQHKKMEEQAEQKFQSLMREAASSKNQYINPLKAFLGLVDSAADLLVGTVQASGVGYAMAIDRLTGTDADEVARKGRAVLKGTAAERVFGP